jgi:hypothetical protein
LDNLENPVTALFILNRLCDVELQRYGFSSFIKLKLCSLNRRF